MAAGRGTRLAPLTDYLPKPVIPVCNRPVLEHLLRKLARSEVHEVTINLHHHAQTIRDTFGDGSRLGLQIHWNYEPELLGTAGGTRMFADVLAADEQPFFVLSADGLHDVDLRALAARHAASGAYATLTAKVVPDPHRYGVCVVDDEDLVVDFQEKPTPAEARSDLASCGVYVFEPRVFERLPRGEFRDWAKDLLPAALAAGERLAVYRTDGYWNDVGSVDELLNGNLDPLRGLLDLDLGELRAPDAVIAEDAVLEGEVLVGAGARIEAGVRIVGPAVIGPRAVLGAGAALRSAVVLPGASVAPGSLVAGGVVGDGAALRDAWA
jgi:mannose-1-phosphate guanylyltransferase